VSGEAWFAAADPAIGTSPVFKNSSVQVFVDAEEYYTDLRKEVEATARGDLVCWIGFEGAGATPMPLDPTANKPANVPARTLKPFPPREPADGDVTWLDLLKAADGRGVPIRALLNLHPKPDLTPGVPKKYKTSNFDLVEELNKLTNCLAINDFRYLQVNGTHHQKLVLVVNKSGLNAYVGTCDVELARITQRWAEVHCKVMGDAAAELYSVFARRWTEHTAVFARAGSQNSYLKPVGDLKATASRSGNLLVQLSTTYGNPDLDNPFVTEVTSAPARQVVNQPHVVDIHSDSIALSAALLFAPYSVGNDFFCQVDPAARPLLLEAAKQAPAYAFAPNGNTGIYRAITAAIANARETIYLEDQYLVNDVAMGKLGPIVDQLVKKLGEPGFKKLVVLCTRIDDINGEFQGTGWAHRRNFVKKLTDAAYDKVVVCQYKTRGTLGIKDGPPHGAAYYIHSKTWIFDDQFLITGSANCNRRGYSHDSELDVGIHDQDQRLVRELRVRLWNNRLNTEGMTKDSVPVAALTDFLAAAKYWEQPSTYGLTIQSNREVSLEPAVNKDLDLATYRARVTGATGAGLAISAWLDAVKMQGLWDYVVDPDGI
jgi:phosphatidylserine/phosphatidylglycerophosphate/cardiolipin synthase-like enzyme